MQKGVAVTINPFSVCGCLFSLRVFVARLAETQEVATGVGR